MSLKTKIVPLSLGLIMSKQPPFCALFSCIGCFISTSIPLLLSLGILYFAIRLFVDSHLLFNLHKIEIESFAKIPQNAALKIIFCLCFFQFSVFGRFLADKNYVCCAVIFILLSFTIWFYFLYQRKILKPAFFSKIQDSHLQEPNTEFWLSKYCHPFAGKTDTSELISRAFSEYLIIPHGRNLI